MGSPQTWRVSGVFGVFPWEPFVFVSELPLVRLGVTSWDRVWGPASLSQETLLECLPPNYVTRADSSLIV